MAELDFINNRFFDQVVKIPLVICQKFEQEFGEITISAPVGVTINPLTGELTPAVTVRIAGSPILRTATVIPDKIINQGVIPVNVFVAGITLPVIQGLEVPFEGIIDCPGSRPGDIVQKHDFQIEGVSVSGVTVLLPIPGVNLIIKVVFKFCLVVASTRLLKVNAAELTC